MSDMRLAILDSDSGFVRVLVKRASDLGWQYRRLEAPPRTEDFVAMRVNALVVDLELLGPGSWEFLERVADALPGLGVVVCTGRSSVAQRVRGLRLGADDWVTKPCHPEEVLARVEAVVRRRKRASARVDTGPLLAGELEIRADQFQAFVRTTSVDLTRREFEVLQLLAQAKGKVLQREEIYQAVWGYTMAHGDRSVDVFVRKVRQKLEKVSPDWNYIHTHFGVGYRFEPERRDGAATTAIRSRSSPSRRSPMPSRRWRAASRPKSPPCSTTIRPLCCRARPRRRARAPKPAVSSRCGPEPTSESATARDTPTSTSVRRARSRAGGRVGPCASDATTAISPSATSSQAALHASSPCCPVSDSALSWASEPAASSARRPAAPSRLGVRAALGVRDQHAEAALTQLGGGVVEVAADALERGLHQHPARPRGALRDQLELALAHAADQLVAELRAAAQLELESRAAASAPRSSMTRAWISTASVTPRSARERAA